MSNVIDTYCSDCHNGRIRSPSGFLLDRFDAAAIAANHEVWSRACRQIQAGTMPPVDVPRPDRAMVDAVLASNALGATEEPPAAAPSQEADLGAANEQQRLVVELQAVGA